MRDRIRDRLTFAKYDFREFRRYGFWRRLAGRMPERLLYAAGIELTVRTLGGDEHPDTLGTMEAVRRLSA